jgi:hypothetical protein
MLGTHGLVPSCRNQPIGTPCFKCRMWQVPRTALPMSEDEQIFAIGRVILGYADARRKLAVLLAEGVRLGGQIESVAWYLVPRQCGGTDMKSGGKPPDLSSFPTADQLRTIIDDARATIQRKQELKSQLKEFGVEPKD